VDDKVCYLTEGGVLRVIDGPEYKLSQNA